MSGHDSNEEIGGCGQKIDFWPKNPLLGPKRATFGNRCRKTAVGGSLTARRAVFRHRLPKVALFGPKTAVFWPEINFLWTAPKEIVAIMTGHLKDNLFVLTAVQGGLWAGVSALFWAQNGLKI